MFYGNGLKYYSECTKFLIQWKRFKIQIGINSIKSSDKTHSLIYRRLAFSIYKSC